MKNSSSVKIAPSILSGDFGYLADAARRVTDAGADYIHIDIMDGSFVPNITMGPKAVAAINRATNLFLDVHLMIYNPFEFIEPFVEAGADMLTFHFEATEDVIETLKYIRRCNVKAGLAFNPETSASFVNKYLEHCDMILLMTVRPGFGGQAFIPDVIEKISYVRKLCNEMNIRQGGIVAPQDKNLPPFDIEVDGGINEKTGRQCIEAGANVLVSGTYLFEQRDMKHGIQELRGAA